MKQLNQYHWDPKTDKRGEGSFAQVFEAKDNNGDSVALKIYRDSVIQSSTSGSAKGKYSLENEFAKGKHLSHTNVIRYISLDYIVHADFMEQQSSFPVLIMEYADAGSLEGRLKDAFPSREETGLTTELFKPEEILTIAKEILLGLFYLHNQAIIHRDLKPANILFKTDRHGKPVVKITDFGISRDTLTKNTDTSTIGVGTVNYMAPEQFLPKTYGINGAISNATDIWAFGVIFYRMLTGKLPFITQEEITGAEPDYSKVPAKYRAVIKGCLQKNANRRFANAELVLNAISHGGSGGAVPPDESWFTKHKKLLLGVGIFLLCAIGVSLYMGIRYYYVPIYVTNQEIDIKDLKLKTTRTCTYTGWVKGGMPNGEGTKIFGNGDKYEGESKDGFADGSGKMYYKQDSGYDVYEGPFVYGKPNGKGTYTSQNGDVYSGDFKDGEEIGDGTFYLNRDDQYKGDKYVGQFVGGLYEGTGTFYWQNGDIYTGQFVKNACQGQGKRTYSDGRVYEGKFSKGLPDGQGIMTYTDHNKYDGEWVQGKREGQGAIIEPSGVKLVGTFSNDAADGYLKLYDSDGSYSRTIHYINGVMQSE